MRILITGASGLLGLNTALETADQHTVFGQVNSNVIETDAFTVLQTDLLEPGAVVALCELVDSTPRLARSLEEGARTGVWDQGLTTARNIDSMTDLMTIDGFLKSLAEQFRRSTDQSPEPGD